MEAGGGVDTDEEEVRERGGIMGEREAERRGKQKGKREKKKRNNESVCKMCASCISPVCWSF